VAFSDQACWHFIDFGLMISLRVFVAAIFRHPLFANQSPDILLGGNHAAAERLKHLEGGQP
jgi:hypothetical protein